ncbi:ShlB/FhaC/HecB family hemolysin secretion/activation protein [Waterburya agarophytonicola K14]|uniref:ShlB/FhaC/HecB family hemolysin secretion/activation protein n=1 Tax=Waterburya agarophytonicola KI4 TaxID=2874699 RepID=A0A964BT50_9CYAN|nr:ShlB/FhaC/HecB family hemolysin secretion/activation protein [Waterburya agarophytonicola]MCC0177380.1 ShlB/FhaC/HecB family hemolysin secretion/activation protein [Waterburya agarophytonicola KI4]
MQYRVFNQKLGKVLATVNSLDTVLVCLLCYFFFTSRKAVADPPPLPPKFIPQTSLSPEDIPDTIAISRFEIIGNRVIPQPELDRVLNPYLFRPISFTELLEVQQAITQLYVDRGYFTSGAFIPPQTINHRTIRVQIIEGTIGEIKVLGLEKLPPEYIRSRIAIASQAPLNQNKLLEALQKLQLNPLIEHISAELSQGIKPGESFLKLKIKEADSFDLTFNTDNDLTTSIGSIRGRVSIDERNLLGFGDSFRVGYARSEGSESLERIEYIAPLGARGTSVRLSHSRSDNKIIIDPFPVLDLESKNRGYGITLIQDAIDRPTQNLLFAFGFTHQNSKFSLMNLGFPDLARGLDDRGRSITSTLHLIQEYNSRSKDRVFSLASQIAIGIDALDSTINNDDLPDSKYLIWRGQTRYIKALSAKTNLSLGGTIQFADRPLFSNEQFIAGGVQSVRGYSRDIIRGDNGFSFSAELGNTVVQVPKWDLRVEVIPFFDFARIWNSDDFPIQTNTLASVGIATQISIDDHFNFSVGIGIPLIDDKLPEKKSLQDNGIYFSLSVKPF